MTGQPSILARDAPNVDQQRLRAQTGVDKPVAAPSLWSQFNTTAENAAGYSELHQTERDNALESAYDGVIAELAKRGADTHSMGWSPLPYSRKIYNPDAIWQGVAAARAQDPKAFADLPADLTGFQHKLTAPIDAKYAGRESIEQGSGWVPWVAGQFLGGASDPLNQVGMLTGAGEAKTFLGGVLKSAGTNAYLTAVTEPAKMLDRAAMGETTSPGEVIGDIATSGAIGGVLHTGMHGLGKLGESVWGRTAAEASEQIGPDRMTEAERAATETLHRADEVAAISPYHPGPGTDTHFARMDAATAQLEAPSGIAAAPVPAAPPRFDVDGYAARVGSAESNGSYRAQAEGSSAFGMYQITRPTWLRLAADDPKMFGGLSDDAKWNMRTNPATQERMFKRLVEQQRAALERIGVPETYGNMYLMHFAGEGGATKILRAAPDTPIGDILSARAIEANPFLKGKTAGDVISWAHARMKDPEHGGAVLRRDVFDSDGEWAAAQRSSDDATHAFELAQRDAEEATRPPTAPPLRDDIGDPNTWGDWHDDVPARPESDLAPEAAVPRETVPDVPREAETMPASDYLDRYADRISPREAVEHAPRETQGSLLIAPDGSVHALRLGGDGVTEAVNHADFGRAIDPHEAAGYAAMTTYRDEIALRRAAAPTRAQDRTIAEITGRARREGRPVTEGGVSGKIDPAYALPERAPETRVPRETSPDVPRDERPPPATEGFDHPVDVAAQRQIDSIEHDLRQHAEAEPGASYRIDEEGGERTIGQIFDELDADDAAIEAARACL